MIGEFSVSDMHNFVNKHIILSLQDPRFDALDIGDLVVIISHAGS